LKSNSDQASYLPCICSRHETSTQHHTK